MKLPTSARGVVLALSALTALSPAGANPTAQLPQVSSPTTAPVATSSPISEPPSAAAPKQSMTLLQLCPKLPNGETRNEQFSAYEHCTKQQGPVRIANHYADIYQKNGVNSSLTYQDGSLLEFKDVTEDNPDTYQAYALWGCDQSQRYCVIHHFIWEDFSYLLIDRQTKQRIELTGAPMFSPDSQLLFEYLDSRISELSSHNIIKLYRLSNGKLELLLDQSDAKFGVHSATWTGPHTLTATLQDFTPGSYSSYSNIGTMRLEVQRKDVQVDIEKTPAK